MSYVSSAGSGGGGGGSGIQTITGNSGGAVGPSGNNINIIGSGGITATGNPGTNTITLTTSGSFTWNTVTATSAMIIATNGYITNNSSLVTLTLPSTASVGDTYRVTGLGAGGWLIAQNASQIIHFGSASTTTGTGGSLASTNQWDSVEILCIVANTTFTVLSAVGNLTVT